MRNEIKPLIPPYRTRKNVPFKISLISILFGDSHYFYYNNKDKKFLVRYYVDLSK